MSRSRTDFIQFFQPTMSVSIHRAKWDRILSQMERFRPAFCWAQLTPASIRGNRGMKFFMGIIPSTHSPAVRRIDADDPDLIGKFPGSQIKKIFLIYTDGIG
jgi:hypothetical protein